MTRFRPIFGLLAATLLVFAGCASTRGGLLSTHDEIHLGITLMQELESTELLLTDETILTYVDRVGRNLVREAIRRHVPYTFKVIEDAEAVDAFALPGGYFYVTTGMLARCENEAELAGLMAHELAHVISRHHGKILSRRYGAKLLQGQLLGSDAGATQEMAIDILNHMTTIHFTERQEREADAVATDLMMRAGYDPQAFPALLLRLYEEGVALDEQPEIFSGSFQPTPERLDRLYEFSLEFPRKERETVQLFPERYNETVKARLN